MTTAYTIGANRMKFEPGSLHMIISNGVFYFFELSEDIVYSLIVLIELWRHQNDVMNFRIWTDFFIYYLSYIDNECV